jgi:hypothetical protein
MMSRADLMTLPSICAVVSGVSACPFVFFLRAIEQTLQIVHSLPELIGATKQPNDL